MDVFPGRLANALDYKSKGQGSTPGSDRAKKVVHCLSFKVLARQQLCRLVGDCLAFVCTASTKLTPSNIHARRHQEFVGSWIVTSCQLYRVSSGRITLNTFPQPFRKRRPDGQWHANAHVTKKSTKHHLPGTLPSPETSRVELSTKHRLPGTFPSPETTRVELSTKHCMSGTLPSPETSRVELSTKHRVPGTLPFLETTRVELSTKHHLPGTLHLRKQVG